MIYGNNPDSFPMHYFLRQGKQPNTMCVAPPSPHTHPTLTHTQIAVLPLPERARLQVESELAQDGGAPPPSFSLEPIISNLTTPRAQCFDGRTLLATWEVSPPREDYFASLVVRERGMSIITEILTSLIINRMAMALGW